MKLKDLAELLEEIADHVEEMLDPELTREELVAKVKELAAMLPDDEAEVDEDEDEG